MLTEEECTIVWAESMRRFSSPPLSEDKDRGIDITKHQLRMEVIEADKLLDDVEVPEEVTTDWVRSQQDRFQSAFTPKDMGGLNDRQRDVVIKLLVEMRVSSEART